ncbi:MULTISPECIES: RNA polymerase factor sigma-54 [Thiomicrorhabdus]|uniref:RNA polymerase sigma-54 factor n=1 Tax=Thiomicrorhabdus heinhorstiae TaxID=2748010 RepID=A0ABS0BVR2_9GAMM|nr:MULTISPECIES: RNA polymerase factor sigma-54 [Thiomicrorhabdus]MBF6056886.1 RNA polymerase factor sigma-54 [Thiomicrorhabdus heinhorstiae]
MALMPGLQINIGQQLKLTPQLQQSIKILQYSALEVQQTIESTLETNFMLEVYDENEELASEERNDIEADSAVDSDAEPAPLDIEQANKISDELELDCQWDEVFADHTASSSQSSVADYVSAETYTASEKSLHDHLYWQSDIYPWNERQQIIAPYLIDDINDEGYLSSSLPQLLEAIQENELDLHVTSEELSEVLGVVQQFEPTGVGARDLQESLLLQLGVVKSTPFVVTARQLIKEHFDWLTYQDHKRIKKMYALNDEELHQILKLIQSLNPRPGRTFSATQTEVVVPDLRLRRNRQDGWIVELNADAFPRLTVNSAYVDLASQVQDSNESKKIKEQLTEAKGLIKSIHSRGETLLKVGKFIVEKQQRFFEEGEQAMQPLVLREVAEHLDLHESTISRATNQKYIQTPRGTFELKYFFSSGVSQYGSADQSAIAIKAHIKALIDEEDPKKPLSDSKLMQLLEEKGISVARRTIAKYREALNLPSSSERKKLNKFKF